ncbi:hypothetical protein CEXT_338281 [Caerostris extrusa]|uniref:Uncharacterized protein n=1 Tax=Caerostris extrusa TaxID=172846 RepID=A0AAV4X1D3_CAEEX|nr:hypothetical protein CEXT_338281 [Caerostris extrusa]
MVRAQMPEIRSPNQFPARLLFREGIWMSGRFAKNFLGACIESEFSCLTSSRSTVNFYLLRVEKTGRKSDGAEVLVCLPDLSPSLSWKRPSQFNISDNRFIVTSKVIQ